MKARGFTLIELLVVVLIIGILASSAVAKYQKVITRAKWLDTVGIIKALTASERRYYEMNAKWTTDIKNLDIVVKDVTTLKDFGTLNIHTGNDTTFNSHVELKDKKRNLWIVGMLTKGDVYCAAACSDTLNRKFCESIVMHNNSIIPEPGYCYYIFQ